MRIFVPGTTDVQPADHVFAVDSGNVERQSRTVAAPWQPNMLIPAAWFTWRQPVVFIAFTCVSICAPIVVVHGGGTGSLGMTSFRFGRSRANHSATMSNSGCVSATLSPRGIHTRAVK